MSRIQTSIGIYSNVYLTDGWHNKLCKKVVSYNSRTRVYKLIDLKGLNMTNWMSCQLYPNRLFQVRASAYSTCRILKFDSLQFVEQKIPNYPGDARKQAAITTSMEGTFAYVIGGYLKSNDSYDAGCFQFCLSRKEWI